MFVGDAEHYVAKEVLSVATRIRTVDPTFLVADGWATFPDNRRFSYLIGIDHVLNNYDYFEDKTANKTFGFKKRGKSLEVFGTSGEMSQNVEKEPQLSF